MTRWSLQSHRVKRFGHNRVAADIQGNGGGDFLGKTGLRFRIKRKFRMSLWPKQHDTTFVFWAVF